MNFFPRLHIQNPILMGEQFSVETEAREERRKMQEEKRLSDLINDAYERTDSGSRHFEICD